ncbi:MAG TPA: STAS domain-containing protein [Bryobacteraceae bacterium]|nr:STAS domain-containing protein [Bryobacteraceae bacterium]
MPFRIEGTGQDILLELAGGVTARDVSELAARLASSLTTAARVSVSTRELSDIDTSVLQLLVSLRKTVNCLVVEQPSETFVTAVDRCSLHRELLSGLKDAV